MARNSPDTVTTAWQIENQCPQCGAPATLYETDRLFSCPYCRVRLYVTSKEHFRYYLQPAGRTSKELIFLPYWRCRGMSFYSVPYEIRCGVTDASFPSLDYSFLPPTLGWRPQAMKLRFVCPEVQGTFLKFSQSFKEAMTAFHARSQVLQDSVVKSQVFHQAFVGECVSLIYTPLFIEAGTVYDAIVKKPVAKLRDTGFEELPIPGKAEEWRVRFLSTLCPDCGNDLSGVEESVVLLCRSCNSAWEASASNLERRDYAVMPRKGSDLTYLPFWRMKAAVEGIQLRTYADLVRLANLPKVVRKEWEGQEICLWSPAFKINPPVFLRLARQITIAQPPGEGERGISMSVAYPVTLPVNEATESLKVTLANIVMNKKRIFPHLDTISVRPVASLLVYVPFTMSGEELIQSEMGISIQKSTLTMGRNI